MIPRETFGRLANARQRWLRPHVYSRAISSSHAILENGNLFNYTSGRWLWNEQKQLDMRYRRFNVESLKKVACEALDSTECISHEKIGEGNYNKAFRLVMQDGRYVIARIPSPNAGPATLTTAFGGGHDGFCRHAGLWHWVMR